VTALTQDVAELADEEIIVLHRNRKPIRAKRMDWRDYPELARLTTEAPGPLPVLPDPEQGLRMRFRLQIWVE